jgi:hypothetical protein
VGAGVLHGSEPSATVVNLLQRDQLSYQVCADFKQAGIHMLAVASFCALLGGRPTDMTSEPTGHHIIESYFQSGGNRKDKRRRRRDITTAGLFSEVQSRIVSPAYLGMYTA